MHLPYIVRVKFTPKSLRKQKPKRTEGRNFDVGETIGCFLFPQMLPSRFFLLMLEKCFHCEIIHIFILRAYFLKYRDAKKQMSMSKLEQLSHGNGVGIPA